LVLSNEASAETGVITFVVFLFNGRVRQNVFLLLANELSLIWVQKSFESTGVCSLSLKNSINIHFFLDNLQTFSHNLVTAAPAAAKFDMSKYFLSSSHFLDSGTVLNSFASIF
jgi:hypothetical protein